MECKVKQEEPKVLDPTQEPDLRLTMREWVVYWKSRYEDALKKIVAADRIITILKDKVNEQRNELKQLKGEIPENPLKKYDKPSVEKGKKK